MSGRPGEVSPKWASRKLEVHIRTVRRWCWEGKLAYRRDAAGRYWVQKSEIESIAADPVRWRAAIAEA